MGQRVISLSPPCILAIISALAADVARAEQHFEAPPSRLDRYADPLPLGAVARLGTVRMHHASCFAYSPDGKSLATAEDRFIHLWDLATKKELAGSPWRLAHDRTARALCFSPNGQRLAAVNALGIQVECWDVRRGKSLFVALADPRQGGTWLNSAGVTFSPDGKILYVGNGLTVHGWDATTGKEVLRFQHTKQSPIKVNSTACSPDGATFATGAVGEGSVRLWDRGGRLLHVLPCGKEGVHCLAFNGSGSLLTGGCDKTTYLWEVRTGRQVRKFEGHAEVVVAVAFAPDGKGLTTATNPTVDGSGTGEQAIRLWDLTKGAKPEKIIYMARSEPWPSRLMGACLRLLAGNGKFIFGTSAVPGKPRCSRKRES